MWLVSQALEDEAAGHWSLVGKVTEESGDEEEEHGTKGRASAFELS